MRMFPNGPQECRNMKLERKTLQGNPKITRHRYVYNLTKLLAISRPI